MEERTTPRFLNLAGLPPGFRLRDLELQESIGKGGFGAVYRATRNGKEYAVKLPLIEPPKSEEEMDTARRTHARVDREIATLKALRHPNIVSITEFFSWDPATDELGTDGGMPVIVMPFIRGVTLYAWIRRNQPSLRSVLKGLRDIASALNEVHKRDFVHRDLKPSNILVDGAGKHVLIDFGIAKGTAVHTVTAQAEFIGTIDYTSPEYFAHVTSRDGLEGKPFTYGAKQDLYALGACYYQVLAGCRPFSHYDEYLESGAMALITPERVRIATEGEIFPPDAINDALPEDVGALVMQLLARHPEERPASGKALADAVDSILAANTGKAAFEEPFILPQSEASEARAKESSQKLLSAREAKRASGPTAPLPSMPVPTRAMRVAPSGAPTVDGGAVLLKPPPPPTASIEIRPPAPPTASVELQRPGPLPRPAPSAPSLRAPVSPPQLASPAPGAAFNPPSVAQELPSFASPLSVVATPAPAVEIAATPAVDPNIARLRSQLAPKQTSPARFVFMASGAVLVGAIIVAVPMLAMRKQQASTPQPVSLLDAPADKPAAPPPAPAPLPVVQPTVAVAAPVAEAPAVAAPIDSPRPQPYVAAAGAPKKKPLDATAVDELLAKEYGGKRPVVSADGTPAAPAAAVPAGPDFVIRAGSTTPTALPAIGGRRFGIGTGAEIAAKLTKPLDSRISNSVVVAKLARPYAPRGDVLLPTGTFVYGTATASTGRFELRLTKLKLPDGTESSFVALGYDVSDKKAGLLPSRRIAAAPAAQNNLGDVVVRGVANSALGKVPGGDVGDIAKGAGQTVVSGSGSAPGQPGSGQEALLLDAPQDFTIFVTEAF